MSDAAVASAFQATPPLETNGHANCKNVLLICDEIADYQQLVDAANSDTLAIVYSISSTKQDVLDVLHARVASSMIIERLAFAFHSSGPGNKRFLDLEFLFEDDETPSAHSSNVAWLIEVIQTFKVENMDFLACGTLNYENWRNFYDILAKETGVIVGASDDDTGNLKYGGDWVMENTKEDIELTYFTPDIENYQHVFAFPITQNSIIYQQNGSNAYVSGFVNGITTCDISSSVTNSGTSYPVTYINGSAFQNCATLTTVIIPTSITNIVNNAFFGCSKLNSVTFTSVSQVKNISPNAFNSCTSLASISIPASVTNIDSNAFFGDVSLNSITFDPSSQLTTIGTSAFDNCQVLTSVAIPATVTSIGVQAFNNNYGMRSITFTAPSQVNSIGSNAFSGIRALSTISFDLSSTTLKTLSDHAFVGDPSLVSVTLPSSITSVGDYLFQNCTNLNNVDFGNNNDLSGVFPDNVFSGCTKINTVNLGLTSKLTTIGVAFRASSLNLRTITIPSSVTSLDKLAFQGNTTLKNVYFGPNSQLNGLNTSFNGSGIISIQIPAAVRDLSANPDLNNNGGPFQNCSSLQTVTFEQPSQLKLIDFQAFRDCRQLQSIAIPMGVTVIGSNAFTYDSSLSSVTFDPSSVLKSLDTSAFFSCTSLTSISIPASITRVGSSVFNSCSNLSNITFTAPSQLQSVLDYAFSTCPKLSLINFDLSSTTLKTLSDHAFAGDPSLVSVTLPSSITSVGDYLFQNCTNLNNVDFGNNNDLSGVFPDNVFSGCTKINTVNLGLTSKLTTIGLAFQASSLNLRTITIPASVTSINNVAFLGNTTLQNVYFGPSSQLKLIDERTFYYCTSLRAIQIPAAVTELNCTTPQSTNPTYGAFQGCSSLQTVTFEQPSQLKIIKTSVFRDCVQLQSIAIPAGVTLISSQSFYGDVSLNSITFDPSSQLSTINYNAFGGCGLTTLTLPATVTYIGGNAFSSMTKLSTVTFSSPSQIQTIDYNAFAYCAKLLNMNFDLSSTTLKTIGESAFMSDICLNTIVIPSSVTNLSANYIFKDCTNLQSVDFGNANQLNDPINTTMFQNCTKLKTVNFGLTSNFKNLYTMVTVFNSYLKTVTIPSSVTAISLSAFKNNAQLQTVTFGPNSQLALIGVSTFQSCTSLKSIAIPATVTNISSTAFAYCSQLQSVTFDVSSQLRNIEYGALRDCTLLKYIKIPAGVTNIDGVAFYNSLSGYTQFLSKTALPSIGYLTFNGNGKAIYYASVAGNPSQTLIASGFSSAYSSPLASTARISSALQTGTKSMEILGTNIADISSVIVNQNEVSVSDLSYSYLSNGSYGTALTVSFPVPLPAPITQMSLVDVIGRSSNNVVPTVSRQFKFYTDSYTNTNNGVVVDDTYLYACARTNIIKIRLLDGVLMDSAFATGFTNASYMTIVNSQLYVSDPSTNLISQIDLSTNGLPQIFFNGTTGALVNPTGMASDNTYLYVCNNNSPQNFITKINLSDSNDYTTINVIPNIANLKYNTIMNNKLYVSDGSASIYTLDLSSNNNYVPSVYATFPSGSKTCGMTGFESTLYVVLKDRLASIDSKLVITNNLLPLTNGDSICLGVGTNRALYVSTNEPTLYRVDIKYYTISNSASVVALLSDTTTSSLVVTSPKITITTTSGVLSTSTIPKTFTTDLPGGTIITL